MIDFLLEQMRENLSKIPDFRKYNKPFNAPKNQGYYLEHNHGMVKKYLATCKARSFNFGDTHVMKQEHIFTLIFLIIGAIKTGEWGLNTN